MSSLEPRPPGDSAPEARFPPVDPLSGSPATTGRSGCEVRMERVPGRPALPLPAYQTEQSAGADLPAALDEPLTIRPGEVHLVPTGWRIALPPAHEAQVRPRSGLARHAGITVANAPGTIDADYRGEICVLLTKLTPGEHVIRPGERIAQLVVAPVRQATFVEAELPRDTERGSGGFGSTGRVEKTG